MQRSEFVARYVALVCLLFSGGPTAGAAADARAGNSYCDLAVLQPAEYIRGDGRDTLYLYLKNPTAKPFTIKEIFVQGIRIPYPPSAGGDKKLIRETGIMWADLVSEDLAPGAWSELKVRYMEKSGITNRFNLKLALGDGTVVEEQAPVVRQPALHFKAYCFEKGFGKAWVYIQGAKERKIEKVQVEGQDVTARTVVREVAGTGMRLLGITFQEPVPWGNYRIIKVTSDQGANACRIKAINPFFFVSVWCGHLFPDPAKGQAPSEEWLKDYVEHQVNTLQSGWLHQAHKLPDGAEGALKLLAKYKLNYAGNRWGNIEGFGHIVERAKKLGNDPRLVFWEILDEPGWQCSEILPTIDLHDWAIPYRKFTRQPTSISHAAYGVIAPHAYGNGHFVFRDYDYSDIAALFRYPVENEPGPLVTIETEMDALRAAVAPKPVSFVAQAFADGARWPTPDEERLMVYMAVAHGAKGMSYFAYGPWGGGTTGVGTNPDPAPQKLWQEIKPLNAELTVLGDLLVKSEPAALARSSREKVETAALLCAEEAIVLVALNHDYDYSKEKFIPHPATNVRIEADIPAWFTVKEVLALNGPDLKKIKYEQAAGKLAFTLDEIRTARVVVLSGERKLFERIKDRFAQLQKR